MKWRYVFKAFRAIGIISSWMAQALADGKVTFNEAVTLARDLCNLLGIPCEIDTPKRS